MRKKIYSIMGAFALSWTLLHGQATATFNFTGGTQTFTVPCGVDSVFVQAWGGQGGTGATGGNSSTGGSGGLGGYAEGWLLVNAGDVLTVYVGGQGATPTGGFNGGANGGTQDAGGGGGASDVRTGAAALADRVITAAGGGGGGRGGCEPSNVNGGNGGSGGGGNGADGTTSPDGGGGFGAIGSNAGAAGIGCSGFLGSVGSAGSTGLGGPGGAGQSCCCFSAGSIPGGGGGGGGQIGGGGGGGGSAGTTGCSGNNKGGGGGGAGGTSYTGGVLNGATNPGIWLGNGMVSLSWTDPTPGALTFTGSSTICDNVVGTLSCNTDPYATFYTWTLDPALTFISGQNTTAITYSGAAGTYTITVNGTNGTCSLTGPTTTFTVTINASPTVTATSASPICDGSSTMASATGASTYAWEPGTLTGSTITVSPTATTTYTVVGTDSGTGCMDTTMTTVVVNPLPTISATATPATTVCEGTMVTANGTGGVSYVWSGGITDGVPFAATTTQTYTCTGTDANGCVGTFTGTITVNPLPTPTVTSATSSPCLNDAAVTLTGSPVGGSFSGTGVTGSSFNPMTAGVGATVVTYTYTDANSCVGTATTTITVNACTGISTVADLRTMSLTPNPASDVMHLTWDLNKAAVNTLEIFDVTGRVVMTQAVNGGNSVEINVANLPAGNYNLVVTAASGKATYPFVKQ